MDHQAHLIKLKEQGKEASAQIAATLLEWKSQFSLGWYQKNCQKQPSKLTSVWSLLFELTEFPDTNVNIAAFNAIGSFVITLSPFILPSLVTSFKKAIEGLKASPNTSMAIISAYAVLSQRFAPHKISELIEAIPMLSHFGVDLRSYIQHIPNLVEQMSAFPLHFHQVLLRSLITSFGRSPTSYFVDAVICLLNRFPTELMHDLTEYITMNDLKSTLMAIGSQLLKKASLATLLSKDTKLELLEMAKNVLTEDANSASEVEQAVAVVSSLISNKDEELKAKALEISMDIQTKEFKPHLKRLLFPLSLDFEELRPQEGDSSNILAAKVAAMKKFVPNKSIEILEIVSGFLNRRDEVFLSVVEFLAKSKTILTKNMDSAAPIIISLLEAKDMSWVQKNAVLRIIENLNQFIVIKTIKDYQERAVRFIMSVVVSPHSDLSKHAIETATSFVGLSNVRIFIREIMKADIFDIKATEKILLLVNAMIDIHNAPVFRILVELVCEIVTFYSDQPFITLAFRFLANFPNVEYDPIMAEICSEKMQQYFWSFTQKSILTPAIPTLTEMGPMMAGITTDIIASTNLSSYSMITPLRDCWKFMVSCCSDYRHISNMAFGLLHLLPSETASPIVMKYVNDVGADTLRPYFDQIVDTSHDTNTITACCVFFGLHGSTQNSRNSMKMMMEQKTVKTAGLAVALTRCLIDPNDEEKQTEFVSSILEMLPLDQQYAYVLKLKQGGSRLINSNIMERYPFLSISENPDAAAKWFEETPVTMWPLTVSAEFTDTATKFLTERKFVKSIDCNEIPENLWPLITTHRDLFEKPTIAKFMGLLATKNKLKKVRAIPKEENHPKFNTPQGLPTIATCAPDLQKGEIIDCVVLLRNFLRFSSIKINKDLLMQIVQNHSELKADAKRYASRCGMRWTLAEEISDIGSIVSNFSVKSKYMREACSRALTAKGDEVEMIRMLAMQRACELNKPKKWFFFIRFLRTTLEIATTDKRKLTVYQKSTAERIPELLKLFTQFDDASLAEMCKLISAVIPTDSLNALVAEFPQVARVAPVTKQDKEDMLVPEIPSFTMNAIRNFKKYSKHDFTKLLDDRKTEMSTNFLFAEVLIKFLLENPAYISKPDMYLSLLLDSTSALYQIGTELAISLMKHPNTSLKTHQSSIENICLNGFSVSATSTICSTFYETLMGCSSASDTTQRYRIQALQQLQNIFVANPTVCNAKEFAKALIDASECYDSLFLIMGKLAVIEGGFFAVFLIAVLYYRHSTGDQSRFAKTLAEMNCMFPRKSRGLALSFIIKDQITEGFFLALAETDN